MGKGKRSEPSTPFYKKAWQALQPAWQFAVKHKKIFIPVGAGVSALILALVMVFSLSWLIWPEQPPEPEETAPTPSPVLQSPSPLPSPSPEQSPPPMPISAVSTLTGLPMENKEAVQSRPVAVMHNNYYVTKGSNHALPMFGLSRADIIYEVLAEGSTTRMLAFYQDISGIPQIGSVRSARRYYLELALAYDAIYIHAGASPEAYSDIRNWGVDAFDGTMGYAGALFWRDKDRISAGVSSEHTLFTSGDNILAGIESRSFRTALLEGHSNGLHFSDEAAPEGGRAETIEVALVSSKKTMFEYRDDGLYYVGQYGDPLIDGENGEQIAVTNILILQTSFVTLDGEGRQRVDLTRPDGRGYYISGGRYTEITWSRDAHDAPFRYFGAGGSPLELLPGKSYICVIPDSQTPIFE